MLTSVLYTAGNRGYITLFAGNLISPWLTFSYCARTFFRPNGVPFGGEYNRNPTESEYLVSRDALLRRSSRIAGQDVGRSVVICLWNHRL